MKIDEVLAKFEKIIVYLQLINFTYNGETQDMI